MPTISTAEYWTTIRREPFLVGYWRANESSGETQAVDSGARYDLVGTYADDQTLGPALIKDDTAAGSTVIGSSGGLSVPDTDVLQITGDITLEAVILPYSQSQSAAIIGKLDVDSTYANPYALRLSNGQLQFALGDGTTETTLTSGIPPVSMPSLVQAVCFRGAMSLLINGVTVATGVLGSQTVSDGGKPLWIGYSAHLGSFDGLLGEVAVYNGALSKQRAARHFSLAQQIYPDQAHFLGVDPPVLTA